MKNLRQFVFICLLVSIVSCDDQRVYDQYQSVSGSWEATEKIDFELPQLDSLATYNLFFNIRNTNEYQYSNLFLISQMQFPNGKSVVDTLEYEMATPDGSWLGTGFSDIKESKLWYKENVAFIEKGNYKITVQHAMRKNGKVAGIQSLQGITDVGFRIEKSQNP